MTKIYERNGEWGGVAVTISDDGVKIAPWSRIQGSHTGGETKYYFPVVVAHQKTYGSAEDLIGDWDNGWNDIYTVGDMVFDGMINSAKWRRLRTGHTVR